MLRLLWEGYVDSLQHSTKKNDSIKTDNTA